LLSWPPASTGWPGRLIAQVQAQYYKSCVQENFPVRTRITYVSSCPIVGVTSFPRQISALAVFFFTVQFTIMELSVSFLVVVRNTPQATQAFERAVDTRGDLGLRNHMTSKDITCIITVDFVK